MARTLQLEYACTERELKEAQALNLHRQCGGGPKWRSRLVYYAFAAFLATLLYLRIKTEIVPKDRIWFMALAVVIFIALVVFKRKTRAKSDGGVRVEISETGVTFISGGGHASMPWSAFSDCLESPSMFVLLDRTKSILRVFPKRAFPDEQSHEWFRALANQPRSIAPSAAREPVVPMRTMGKGVTLTVHLKYRDYLTRMLTSWRFRGITLLILAFVVGLSLYSVVNPPPDAVIPPWEALLIVIGMMAPMLVVVFFVVAFVSWRSEKKFLSPQCVGLSGDGIEVASDDATGLLPWTTYKYYLENRWAFFMWHPSGSLWIMFPKRQFGSPWDVERCRDLLQSNLKASRWFYM